ncbi:MAG: (2Fe-2S)-binding protein [Gordonia sp.]|uniref:2Fe-2S iron-sulfur cluster-binding protein n=1 Tax=Gordonia rubripertincta TaxID=36822 RepID=A0ABT4MUN5_GORRU|nr:2Fe-2S iron-sulfur cluster-binding protein [Gordonia rubripertincta]MBA4020889.1 (2Fe-2S)-binding protein [Gordonia sp. (in: high G+C Gram-positive bacteria)]MCZ4550722.1 2Fe-2S iron-sulfur cluster-binding protein [Gordonia rubripertincta]
MDDQPSSRSVAVRSGPVQTIGLQVNGEHHDIECDPRTTLLDALRDHIGLTGSKKGCDRGQCGACTVLVDDRRVVSCLMLAVSAQNHRITTIEGIDQVPTGATLQQAFIEHDGFQCGFCTPGQICSAVGMLDEAKHGWPSAATEDVVDPHDIVLDDDEIRERLSGNICRCGAYVNILAAVRSAADETAADGESS